MPPSPIDRTPLTSSRIRQLLEPVMDAARILTRPIELVAYASDASFYRLIPRAVVQPVSAEEVVHLFRFSHAYRVPLTFRAGGTSLSGQAISDGVLVDVGRYMRNLRVEANGKAIRLQPGVIGQQANNALRLYGAKIGPDPASIHSCRVGGILANNASGMCCGVAQNAYHTLRSLTFVLPSGTTIHTAEPDAEEKFRALEPVLAEGLLGLKRRIEAEPAMAERIRRKYRMKNTIGYSLNAFADYERAVDIFSHLLIGSEGTLAFIAEAVLETIPDHPVKYTGLLFFADLHAACSAIVPLRDAGAAALELMDRASLRSVESQPGVPRELCSLPDAAAALLVEFQSPMRDQAGAMEKSAAAAVAGLPLLAPAHFTHDPEQQAKLWKVRKGLFPSVGAVRESGTTVIIEDVAVPVARLADAAVDLRRLLDKRGYPGAILFGHAKDGNLHFVITQGFNRQAEVDQYRDLMSDLVELVVGKYDGALKAEHGTGRNMAPFVEREWGHDLYEIMRELKWLADPEGLLNPGVILNPDAQAHLKHLKTMPVVEPEIDKCIECGYCEPKCPSRDLTLTPRQRIVVRREMRRVENSAAEFNALDRDFPYMALDTCAVDGLCATECPVGIDTGTLTKRFRQARHTAVANAIAVAIARNFAVAETGARLSLRAGHLVVRWFGLRTMEGLTNLLNALSTRLFHEPFWRWSKEMPFPQRGGLPNGTTGAADAVYFPACISRMMGALPGEDSDRSVMQVLIELAGRAGVKLLVPQDARGKCCGVPFSSKGFEAAHRAAVNRIIASFFAWSNGGELPVVVDTSPCTYGLRTARAVLTAENQRKFDALTILDSIEFVHDRLLPRLVILRRAESVALHPVCSAVKMGITGKLVRIAESCSEQALVPADNGCCAFAGDRGFLFPELTASATNCAAARVNQREHDGYFSSSRTCEIGMTRATGHVYRSYLHLLEIATRPEEPAVRQEQRDAILLPE